MRTRWNRRPPAPTIAVALSLAIATFAFTVGTGSASAAPRTATVNGSFHPWSPADMDITRARVTYDSRTGYLQVALTHRGPLPRNTRNYSETIALTTTSIYAQSHSEPDGVHIVNSLAHKPSFYLTTGGAQGQRAPVRVDRRGAVTTYTIRSPLTRGRALHFISASANDGRVCESMCAPGGALDERRLPF